MRHVRASAWLETAAQDLRYAARTLARRPAFTVVAVLALALGIGANTAVFSVANAVLLRPLAYADADRLVVILHRGANPVSPANYLDWKRQSRSFARMGAAEYWQPNVTGVDVSERLWALRLTADVLPMLGVTPLLGRVFLDGADESAKEREVVIGWSLWQRRFAADPGVLGRRMTLDGETYIVVGVMPKGFRFAPFWATKAELWAPLELTGRTTSRGGSSLRVFARLAPGVDLLHARAEMATITSRLEREYPGTNREITVLSLKEKVVGDIRPALLVLLGAVTFVLLIACANVAHLLLARAASRQKEIALRTALGATRTRLIRQFLTESLVLAFMGGALGLGLAVIGVRVLVAMSPSRIPRLESIGVDASVLGFVLLVSMITGIAFGLAPALQTSAPDVGETLKKSGGGATPGAQRSRVRGLLVSSEFALALVLLVAAGLMIRSFAALQAIDPGFDPRGVMSMVVSVTGSKESDSRLRPLFFQHVVDRVRAIPGVQSASAINHLPIAGDIWGSPFAVEGRPDPRPGESPVATYRVVMPDYFRTMHLPILRGRDIDARDIASAPRVVIVNEWLARRYWPGEDAIGKRITFDAARTDSAWITVVGVSKDAVRSDWRSEPEEELYIPYLQARQYLVGQSSAVSYLTLVARASCAAAEDCRPAALAPAMRAAVAGVDRNVTVAEAQTLNDVVHEATAEPRFYMLLLGTFALVALTLAALGIYGVMSYSVSRRTHEIGVRMALGARREDVLALVVGQSMRVALLGAVVGIVAAFAVTRLMSTLLYGVSSTDPITFLTAASVLSGVALLASVVPARRATRVDPVTALRAE